MLPAIDPRSVSAALTLATVTVRAEAGPTRHWPRLAALSGCVCNAEKHSRFMTPHSTQPDTRSTKTISARPKETMSNEEKPAAKPDDALRSTSGGDPQFNPPHALRAFPLKKNLPPCGLSSKPSIRFDDDWPGASQRAVASCLECSTAASRRRSLAGSLIGAIAQSAHFAVQLGSMPLAASAPKSCIAPSILCYRQSPNVALTRVNAETAAVSARMIRGPNESTATKG